MMKTRGLWFLAVLCLSVSLVCGALGWWAGRSGAQQMSSVQPVQGVEVSTPTDIRMGRRVRLYLGPQITEEPAFTIIAGRVFRGRELKNALLTLEGNRVYSGSDTDGPLLYIFAGDQILEASGTETPQFVQRGNTIYFGTDPNAPPMLTFQGAHVYRGDPALGRIIATSNTAITEPDLIKLVSLVLYMEYLE